MPDLEGFRIASGPPRVKEFFAIVDNLWKRNPSQWPGPMHQTPETIGLP